MNPDITSRLRSLTPGIKIYNASDREQTGLFNSQGYKFPPGESVVIKGQDMPPRDKYGRPEEEMTRDGKPVSVPNPSATADIIAAHILSDGVNKGLVLLKGDSSDSVEIAEATRRFVKATLAEAKRIESQWLQKVLDAKAAGITLVMPAYVEQAQDFLTKYKGQSVETHKRFVTTIDGRSFNKKSEAKQHIAARYPTKAAEWESLVNDTSGLAEEEAQEASDGLEALDRLAKEVKARKKGE